jgi:hypothetical protein
MPSGLDLRLMALRRATSRQERVNSKCGPPDGYQWEGADECQKNVETIQSRISVQDTSRRTDSNVASREGEWI